ncbi:flagellar FlbD family protein [Candidatus Formimonas warabiya]|uniref:Flagellar FlbD family protein n=1 Tax=Formimonas warabiya TaxID=1761012 RepID=A0A3G1KT80_FORW1|nr:flagellar FlbD family protein [Candidatus Formimonas warabiya]ATW25659.1 hypothetical protein DCMF_13595 [Candidatus Formimonas warabiya]
MIQITTMDKRKVALNPDLLERVETIPETVLTLTNGNKILVCETMSEVIGKFLTYKRLIAGGPELPDAEDQGFFKER